jgi:sugar-phosphatase
MDGTLVESHAAVEHAWQVWADENGIDFARVLPLAHGLASHDVIRRLLPDANEDWVDAAAARQMSLQYGDLDGVHALPGAVELIASLEERAIPWAVVTSADRELARLRLAAAGIEPRVLVTVDDVEAGKPDPEGYLAAASALGVSAADSVVVEDTAAGLEAGRRAGAQTAALRGLEGDVQLRDLRDFPVKFGHLY